MKMSSDVSGTSYAMFTRLILFLVAEETFPPPQ
jgi:hypothetical protein